MTQWQKAQTDSTAWPFEAKAWTKKKEINRETMDIGLWGCLGRGGGKDAQIMVKKFSSKCYTSHRMVPKAISVALDT